MLRAHPHHLIITAPRNTKLGDFTPDPIRGRHTLTVNGNLNPYAFLITLMHELAHLITWQAYKNKAKPHGEEWKAAFNQTLRPFLNQNVFPEDIAVAVDKYLSNPAAATCRDNALSAALFRYDRKAHPDDTILMDIPYNGRFMYGKQNRIFIKKQLQRTRYYCKEEKTQYEYLFNSTTIVRHLK